MATRSRLRVAQVNRQSQSTSSSHCSRSWSARVLSNLAILKTLRRAQHLSYHPRQGFYHLRDTKLRMGNDHLKRTSRECCLDYLSSKPGSGRGRQPQTLIMTPLSWKQQPPVVLICIGTAWQVLKDPLLTGQWRTKKSTSASPSLNLTQCRTRCGASSA